MTQDAGKTEHSQRFPVVEIFGPTLQGEGMTIGQRTVFLRLGGCDYRCQMCDSMHAVDPHQFSKVARKMTAEEISKELHELCYNNNCRWVTISGGNPCLWDIIDVVKYLQSYNIGVTVETQGTIFQEWVKYCDYVTISPKGPGMGEKFEPEKFDEFLTCLDGHSAVCIKVVVFDARDLEFASMIAEMAGWAVNTDSFYLSAGNPNPPDPEHPMQLDAGSSDELLRKSIERLKQLVEDVREYPALKTARVLPQLHTWLWGNEKGR
jgi:7-carboxy-7-deazaguanine synthase